MTQLLTILLLTIVSYTKSLVQVPVAHGDTVSGYLLVPDMAAEQNTPNGTEHGLPAIVAMHDHGAYFTIGKEKLTSPCPLTGKGCPQGGEGASAEATRWVSKFYEGQFVADTLASRRFVVLVIDALYWGERGTTGTNKERKNAQPEFYQHYLNETGEPWFERILADDKACIDYLLTLPYVDSARIGVWGFSMGAYRAWQLAAEDPRIAFCAAANWLTTLEKAENGVSSWSMLRPKMAGIEYGEIVSRIAPRPMLLQYGAQDKLFPYGDHGIRPWPALQVQVLEGEHRFTRTHLQLLLEWLENL